MMADDGRSSDARTAMRYHMRRTVPAREQSSLRPTEPFFSSTSQRVTRNLRLQLGHIDALPKYNMKMLNYNIEELFTESAML